MLCVWHTWKAFSPFSLFSLNHMYKFSSYYCRLQIKLWPIHRLQEISQNHSNKKQWAGLLLQKRKPLQCLIFCFSRVQNCRNLCNEPWFQWYLLIQTWSGGVITLCSIRFLSEKTNHGDWETGFRGDNTAWALRSSPCYTSIFPHHRILASG